jgi:orotate phosphoribosyltransferase
MSMFSREELWRMTPEQMLKKYGGFYRCPRTVGPDGRVHFLGPLAGYTSRGADGRNRVGPEYANFRVFVHDQTALEVIADKLGRRAYDALPNLKWELTFCGIPTGGRTIVRTLKSRTSSRCIWGEKREVGVATATNRAETEIWFGERQKPRPGEKIAVVEDITNAFSTTAEVIQTIEEYGAHVVLIVAFLNRSPTVRGSFSYNGRMIPVTALWDEPMPLYDQTDPVVQGAIRAGKFHLNTKEHWGEFMAAMEKHPERR